MKQKMVTLVALGCCVLSGCGSYGGSTQTPTAVLTADRTSVVEGETIQLDASKSNFSTIDWTLNGEALSECSDVACSLVMPQSGEYEVGISTSMGSGSSDHATVSVSISVVKKGNKVSPSLAASTASSTTSVSDDSSPVPGSSGVIVPSLETSTAVTLTWTKATDDKTAASQLIYKLYKSTSNNLTSVATIEANGTLISTATDIGTYNVTGLTANTLHYLNLIVIDGDGAKSAYTTARNFKVGQVWTQVAAGAHFSARNAAGVTAYNNKLWVIGGSSADSSTDNDVWSSTDGVTWVEEGTIPTGQRIQMITVYDNKMWITGGWNGASLGEALYSTNGTSWDSSHNNAALAYYGSTGLSYNGSFYVMGGASVNYVHRLDATGSAWNTNIQTTVFSARANLAGTVYNNKMWISGGGGTTTGDVWYSSNGITWVEATAGSSNKFSKRESHMMIAHDNKMFVMGGSDPSSGTRNNEVWTSTDGANWTQLTIYGSMFSARNGQRGAIFNNRIYSIGGNTGSNVNEIWYTE